MLVEENDENKSTRNTMDIEWVNNLVGCKAYNVRQDRKIRPWGEWENKKKVGFGFFGFQMKKRIN